MMDSTVDCPFCKILTGKAPANIIYQDEQVTAFRDIHPIARTHILVIPNQHIPSVNELEAKDDQLMGHMVLVARGLAQKEGVSKDGYRLIINTGPHSGQTVLHLHLHLIAGRLTRFVVG